MKRVIAGTLVGCFVVAAAFAQAEIFSATDSLGPGDTTGPTGEWEDTYQFRVMADTLVEVVATSEDLDTFIRAKLPGGQTLENDDYQDFNAGFRTYLAQGGTLTIHVSTRFGSSEGAYTVVAREVQNVPRVGVGETVQGRFAKPTSSGGMVASYVVDGTQGQRITIELVSDDFDTYLEVTGVEGEELSNDDGFADGFDSRLSYEFPADGQILISATSLSRDERGQFELRVIESTSELTDKIEGSLVPGQAEYAYDGTLVAQYEFEGSAGQQVEFLLESDAFDAALYLARPDGTNLTNDDDGGGGTNSRIQIELPEDGTYTLFITSLLQGGEGPYTLSIFE